MFPENFAKFTVNTSAGVSYLIKSQIEDLQLHLKGIPAQVLPSEFCEVFKNTYFVKHLRTTASVCCHANINLEKILLEIDLLLIYLI